MRHYYRVSMPDLPSAVRLGKLYRADCPRCKVKGSTWAERKRSRYAWICTACGSEGSAAAIEVVVLKPRTRRPKGSATIAQEPRKRWPSALTLGRLARLRYAPLRATSGMSDFRDNTGE